MLNQNFEISDYSPDELQIAIELDLVIDQINDLTNEIGEEALEQFLETKQIQNKIDTICENSTKSKKSPKEKNKKTVKMLSREKAKNAAKTNSKHSRFQKITHAIKSVFSATSKQQPIARRKDKIVPPNLSNSTMPKKHKWVLKAYLNNRIEEFTLTDSNDYLIGSSQESDILIPDAKQHISREHAKLSLRDGELFIVDKKSTNGTFLNGYQIPSEEEVKIQLSDKVILADITLEFQQFSSSSKRFDSTL